MVLRDQSRSKMGDGPFERFFSFLRFTFPSVDSVPLFHFSPLKLEDTKKLTIIVPLDPREGPASTMYLSRCEYFCIAHHTTNRGLMAASRERKNQKKGRKNEAPVNSRGRSLSRAVPCIQTSARWNIATVEGEIFIWFHSRHVTCYLLCTTEDRERTGVGR